MSNAPGPSRLVVAAADWRHPAWESAFYPEDLPGDWQLTYYANEFRAVLVAPPADAAAAADWLDAVDTGFGFCLDLRQGGVGVEVLDALAGQTLAVLGTAVDDLLPAGTAVLDPQRPTPLALPYSPAASVFDDIHGSGLRLCLYPVASGLDLPGLRADIETLLADLPGEAYCLMAWCDEPPPLAIMQQAKLIAELLGV